MNRHRTRAFALLALLFLVSPMILAQGLRANDSEIRPEAVTEGQLLFEFVGQVSNLTPTTSTQYGYFTFVSGEAALLSGTPQNETSARFTFYREMTNLGVVLNGTLKILSREGTTTLYLQPSGGATFSNPDSFRAGTPIQTSHSRQQVIVDTVTSAFTVVNFETVTSTPRFTLDGHDKRLGRIGDVYRTSKQGHLNAPSPDGYFSGYSVSVARTTSNLPAPGKGVRESNPRSSGR
jgi:hypothetical protein